MRNKLPCDELPESEKEYNRQTVHEALKAVPALQYYFGAKVITPRLLLQTPPALCGSVNEFRRL